jgi:hypothetical protein
MISISHWGLFPGCVDIDEAWTFGLPFFFAVFSDGRTGRALARDSLRQWAVDFAPRYY